MSNRRSKGIALARHLTSGSGIPGFEWNPASGLITAPTQPYLFSLETSVGLDRYSARVRELPNDGIPAVIRMNKSIANYGDAWVTMRLRDFVPLLTAHYDRGFDPTTSKGE